MRYPKYKYFYAAVDFCVLLGSVFLAKYVYDVVADRNLNIYASWEVWSVLIMVAVCGMFIFIFQYNNLYKLNVFLTRSLQMTLIVKSTFYGICVMVLVSYFVKFPIISDSRLYILIFWGVMLVLFFLIRVLLLRYNYAEHLSKTIFQRNVLILGAGKSGQLFAQALYADNVFGIKLIGFLDDKVPAGTVVFRNLKAIGKISDLKDIVKEQKIDEVDICIDNIGYEELMKIIDDCLKLNISVKVTSEMFNIIPQKMNAEKYFDIPVVDVTNKMNPDIYIVFKRIVDYIGATIGLIILLPFFIICGILIKLSSKGPIIYKQKRIGKDGKEFDFYKFRTMRMIEGEDVNRAKEMVEYMKSNGNGKKIVDEDRITRIGRFLRKYSLDELPQLINVLKGDMSLVGPRPCLTYEYEQYDQWQKRRLTVLPGCTGLWQVSGRSEVSFNDSVVIDIYYINNITPWLDLQLIFKTIPVMIFGTGGK
jgi:exopolysaccharide biosynthesis polyprenyl glycosylphosphotransferase